MPERLAEVEDLSAALIHIWTWFHELSATRGNNGFGPSPITFTEIQAWSQLTGRTLDVWTVEAIKAVDARYLLVVSERE